MQRIRRHPYIIGAIVVLGLSIIGDTGIQALNILIFIVIGLCLLTGILYLNKAIWARTARPMWEAIKHYGDR